MHATAIIIGPRGILITGASGSGKTTLALTLLKAAASSGQHAALVGDDQVVVENACGRLIVRAPKVIAGLAEVFGLGPRHVPFRPAGVIDLVVRLGPSHASPRLQEVGRAKVDGLVLPAIDLPERETIQSALVLTAWLGRPPFVR